MAFVNPSVPETPDSALAPSGAPPYPEPPSPLPWFHHLGSAVTGIALGGFVALMGTLVHRQWYPWLFIAALVVTVTGSIWMSTWRRGWAGAGFAIGWIMVVFVLMQAGPGGDVLIPGEKVGHVPALVGVLWVNLGGLAALAGLLTLRLGVGGPRQVAHATSDRGPHA